MTFVVYLHVVLGEMVPKNLALAGPERAAMVLGPPMVALVTVLKPIVYGLDALANAIVRLFRVEPRSEVISTFTLEEVEAMVDESHDEGMLDQSEYERLAGALGFTSRTVDGRAAPAGPARDGATRRPGLRRRGDLREHRLLPVPGRRRRR